ncbi:MAG: hypothetical protein A2600_02310 [Candidatus Lambdaproteobacteria bacterium RIFOXYD1_FULL_56_27]|uniref:C4-type zinc ribbon domain-containing protein n=1 Tax=Candidatus Lambdaproteobacteria bacterium RIFOXYD2_FULL_56_26 TaxID=1817773 RepID=A0A1F6H2U8_9PROT|nr:MAG: hypothetical protein A2426_09350 [Candidatus Lambdaproteobacteria bacterium RIFOXYC1_FULL_56_13]OGH04614.1 MAG: hypothetical protein A2557_06375 [Candidatus Lambdaproteobacteria bacterium RIFOXYD2_FULL_56_26]OGH09078.1 MAG: hypothetical protein A2600_02310 [Candidatus Lambdaproteobacteria bacterium RIFOXYD1_FULL_56_27]
MHESCEALLQIADQDRLILQSQKGLEALPAKRAKIRAQLDQAEAALGILEKQKKDLTLQIRLREKLVEVENKKAAAANARLMEVHNQKEYSAAQKEVESAGKTVKKVEDQILGLEEKMEPLQAEINLAVAKREEEAKAFAQEDQVFLDEETTLTRTIESGKTLVESLKPKVTDDLMVLYNKLMKRNMIPAAVAISEPFCKGCAASLRAQAFNEIIKSGFGECTTCKRLLFYQPPAPPEPVAAKPKKKAPSKAVE